MALISRTVAGLRFFGPNLEPDEVTRLLGVEPTAAEAQGASVAVGRGRVRTAREGGWRLDSPLAETEPLAQHIAWLLAQTTPDIAAWQSLSRRFRADIFVGLFLASYNEGLSLSPATLAAISERGVELALDIYSDPDSDDQPGV